MKGPKTNTIHSTIQAAILILARQMFPKYLSAEVSSIEKVCQELGCSRSQAYEKLDTLLELLKEIDKPRGRPKNQPSRDNQNSLILAMRDYLMDNPGAVNGSGKRRTYNDGFRRFVLEQMKEGSPGSTFTIEQMSEATGVPLGTLKTWLVVSEKSTESMPLAEDLNDSSEDLPTIKVANPRLSLIINEYTSWKGTFTAFCDHLGRNHRIPFKKTFIASVLASVGMRHKRKKKQPPPPWSDGTYETLFPGFQWVGDGKQLIMDVLGKLLKFNIEAIIDPASGALVGVKATDTEDEKAVIKTFNKAKETAGKAPLALTLDNRPSNHTEAVKEAVSPAKLLPSTPGRATSKAPMEGAFGLFSQMAPEMKIEGTTKREIGRSILQLIVNFWAWARNGKPQRKLGGLTPAEAYLSSSPSEEEIEKAKAYILELERRQEKIRRTREERADPVKLQILTESLNALGIEDPDNRLAISLAGYSIDAIIKGVAIFKTKKEAGTLPKDADEGRYLGGIIRNLSTQQELELFGDYILELRLRQRELSLEPLKIKEAILRNTTEPSELPQRFVERALDVIPLLDFRFWMKNAKKAMSAIAPPMALQAYRHLKRCISCSFSTQKQRREDLLEALSDGFAFATG